MSATAVDERLEALLALLEHERDARCRSLLDDARAQAQAITRGAFQQARQRVHQAIVEERRMGEARLRQARAQIDTRNRHRRHQALIKLLHQAWDLLRGALHERWADAHARRQWVDGLLHTARARLPLGEWTVRHPEGWPEDERRHAREALTGHLGQPPRLVTDEAIAAGLRIEAEGTVLDGTPQGLLADRAAIEARLLALIQYPGRDKEGGARE